MPRLVRILRNVEDIYVDELGRVHIVLKPTQRPRSSSWIKRSRTLPIGMKDHKSHAPSPVNKASVRREERKKD